MLFIQWTSPAREQGPDNNNPKLCQCCIPLSVFSGALRSVYLSVLGAHRQPSSIYACTALRLLMNCHISPQPLWSQCCPFVYVIQFWVVSHISKGRFCIWLCFSTNYACFLCVCVCVCVCVWHCYIKNAKCTCLTLPFVLLTLQDLAHYKERHMICISLTRL